MDPFGLLVSISRDQPECWSIRTSLIHVDWKTVGCTKKITLHVSVELPRCKSKWTCPHKHLFNFISVPSWVFMYIPLCPSILSLKQGHNPAYCKFRYVIFCTKLIKEFWNAYSCLIKNITGSVNLATFLCRKWQ